MIDQSLIMLLLGIAVATGYATLQPAVIAFKENNSYSLKEAYIGFVGCSAINDSTQATCCACRTQSQESTLSTCPASGIRSIEY